MNPKQQLTLLANYFDLNRQVGHTTAMMNGAKETDCIIIAHSLAGVNYLKTFQPKGKVVTMMSIYKELEDQQKPLLIDNAAISALLKTALGEINRLEGKLERELADIKKAARAIADS